MNEKNAKPPGFGYSPCHIIIIIILSKSFKKNLDAGGDEGRDKKHANAVRFSVTFQVIG